MKQIDWSNLGFGYFPTDYNVRCYYRDGKWGQLEVSSEKTINIHMAATCLHYGQEAFEGMKAFRGKDGRIRLFRADENAKRMRRSCEGIMMAPMPEELFLEAIDLVVKKNIDFVPPYESGASLYIRPIVIGLGEQVGVKPASEYLFLVFVTPVGPYFKEGFKPTPMAIMRGYDRAAPLGTGTIKVGGNYAASLKSGVIAHEKGYSAVLYLDAKEKKYIDECGPANFFGIKGNSYITPESTSILPSITNMSLIQIAQDLGMTVERRHVPVEELAEFDEAGACGTAAVISPIAHIDDLDNGKEYVYSKDGQAGPKSTQLYNTLRGIQYGDLEDKHGWITFVE
ncbi:branched-chain amino acid aminotransferase [Porphyromonas levii]|uniref:Branched-chain-amino-acid aminotransferase n=1 Tax=Porphyromonas levii TaxID=28114 RepID=A0A4Y8WSA4_9PORP|nr:branched-chain amino acid aminotransferase [Porphyromonas levii]MBR8703407.1 Branched-chain-amino-acid aminotransferase [Porphyromonas levii]MBR8712621.1 Branched-chain-amino-acid aminotransferase [Porphyromonas levii]MBR8714613.1 Branched-chain-amino-acid aminotransferase [Porphyromonas levii]MBR8727106.1 Branched-chain-amino-acid aminotransferase [Porphyromonas levii]MBR8730009.1 Branched-chain-amino-acid aminotransferase [Porphyromonas levii]